MRALTRRFDGEIGCELPFGGDMALLDADPLLDPLVGGVDQPHQISVGDDLFRQIGADAGDGAADDAH